jgi:hypothetical protein
MDAGRADEPCRAKHEEIGKTSMKLRASFKGTFIILTTVVLASTSTVRQQAQNPENRECSVPAYTGKDLDQKPKMHSKPDPKFTSEELQRYRGRLITLSALRCGSGKVTDIKVIQGLSDNTNEKAVEAARLIKFTAGMKDGNPVSRFITLKYFVKQN